LLVYLLISSPLILPLRVVFTVTARSSEESDIKFT
jgi:hypothetical protein